MSDHEAHPPAAENTGGGGIPKSTWMLAGIGLAALILIIIMTVFFGGDDDKYSSNNQSRGSQIAGQTEAGVLDSKLHLQRCNTPCKFLANEIAEVYTDGEPVLVVPPYWAVKDGLYYGGKGDYPFRDGVIRSGVWSLYHGTDHARIMEVRVLVR
jgi:hypothetical protein